MKLIQNGFKDLFFLQERKIVESLFAMDYGSDYTAGHETRHFSSVRVIIKSANSTNTTLNNLLEFATMIDEHLKKIQVSTELYGIVKFGDVCAKTRFSLGVQCQDNIILSLIDMVNQGYPLKFPTFYHPVTKEDIFLPAILGGLKMGSQENVVENASALRLFYILDVKSDPIKAAKAKIWEEAALQTLSNFTVLLFTFSFDAVVFSRNFCISDSPPKISSFGRQFNQFETRAFRKH